MVELIVNDESLDLYENELISLVMAVNDLASIESREGNYSNQFTIPSTSKNNRIFGYPNELNLVTGFKPTRSRNGRISINGLDVQRGFIQVEEFNQISKEFTVSFFGGNTDWIDLISDKSIRDINLDDLNHNWTPANIVANMNNTEGFIYPFIDYGRYQNKVDSLTNIFNWMPAMFTHTLVSRMFENIGWKLAGSFLNDPIYNKHIIPFSLQNIFYDQNYLDNLGFEANQAILPRAPGIGTPIPGTVIFNEVTTGNNLASYDPITGIYTASSDFNASVYCRVSALDLDSNVITLSVRINGIEVDTFGTIVNWQGALLSGDTIEIYVNEASNLIPNQEIYNKFALTPSTQMIEGNVIPMSGTLPDMSQEDFIRTIFNQFGIIFTSDNISKTVSINLFRDIKSNINKALDWTDKIDISRDISIDYTEIVSDYNKINKYLYKENNVSAEDRIINPILGNGSFSIDNDFLSKEGDIFESEFSASQTVNSFNGVIPLIHIPRYSSPATPIDMPDLDPMPRCAICVNDVNVLDLSKGLSSTISVIGLNSLSSTNTVSYPYFDNTFTGMTEIDSINQSLSFGSNIRPKAHNNLLETYYEDYISILNNPRKVTLRLNLNERDINNLNFLIPIYIGGELNNYFYINRVSDYRPSSNGVTEVELVLIV